MDYAESENLMKQRNVALFIFDDVTVLDFTGPYAVFTSCGQWTGSGYFNVYTVSWDGKAVSARYGLSVNPDYCVDRMPQPDILVIPGGRGAEALVQHDALTSWIKAQSKQAELTLSVCTGALLLAKAGVLQNKRAATYHSTYEALRGIDPTIKTLEGTRWADNGDVITSAGVSAGIDMSLYVVSRLFDMATADRTAQRMEYEHWSTIRPK